MIHSRPGAGRQPGDLPVSAILTTKNEEENVVPCLTTVQWAAEVIVVDSGSTDATLARAAPLADRVLQHEYVSAARQKNWIIPQARHPWVLIIDADERVTPELEADIRRVMTEGPKHRGYWIYRRNTFFGREIRHGGWQKDRVIRLFARDHGSYPDLRVHAELEVDGSVGVLQGRFMHHTIRSLRGYWAKMERYSAWWAEGKAAAGKRASTWTVFFHTVSRFGKMYIIRGGFLDGGHGLLVAILASFSVFQKYANLWELSRSKVDPD